MLLRRVIEHVKEQNWMAVALDFVIVVVGVFIGIQVSNWNEARTERARETGLLENLADDLCSDLRELEQTKNNAAYRFAAQAELLDRAVGWKLPAEVPSSNGPRELPRPDPRPIESAAEAVYFIQMFSTFDAERAAYDGLVSSGDILLIRDQSLVDSLQRHYAFIDGFNDTEDQQFRETRARIMAGLERSGFSAYESVRWNDLLLPVSADLAFLGALKQGAGDAAVHFLVLNRLQEATESLLTDLSVLQCP